MEKREFRRDRSWWHGVRTIRFMQIKRYPIAFDPTTSPWRFRKNGADPCRCAKRKHGQPKVGVGVCSGSGMSLRAAVVDRIEGKRLVRAWLNAVGVWDLDDIEF